MVTAVEREALVGLLRGADLRDCHLEIGTAAGKTLREMILAYQGRELPPFVAIDTFEYFPNQLETVEQNLRAVGIDPGCVTFRKCTSYVAVFKALAAKERFSFIFIDAQHDAFHVMQDLLWTRMLLPGGYVCFHDYAQRFPGVIWAADAFLKKYPNYSRVDLAGSLLILRKESTGSTPEVSNFDLARAYAFRMKGRADRLANRLRQSVGRRAGSSQSRS
jgi:predicted O-methyltransferase YrrM